jgi:site-specific recombinase XerC
MPVHIRERALRDAAAKRKDGKPALDVGKRAELLAQAAEWWAKNAWRPNQLRHAAATQIRKECGSLEQARVVLGHAQTSTAEIYAERDLGEAAAIMKKIG